MVADVHALDGKIPPAEARYGTVVVGAGDAGITAALAAAAAGDSVLLVDENPVSGAHVGSDVPLFFGGRMTTAVQNAGRMVEAVFACNPRLATAFDAGIDVRLGTAAWGLYRNGPAFETMPHAQLGLADATRAWMVGFDRLVLATGARDLVLGFAGWDVPGVMGAQALHALLVRYDALASRRVLILGSGVLACETALLAQARGIEVAGLVEVLDTVQAPADLARRVALLGIPVFLRHAIAATRTGIDGIEAAILHSAAGAATAIACDTICLAIGTLPATELLEAAGICLAGETSISLAGDAAGPGPDMAYVTAWSQALGRLAPPETIVCACEAVSRADILGVQPPDYLARPPALAARSLASLAADGPAHPDQIKRLTRTGMGACQGRRCRTAVACLLAEATGVPVAQVPVASQRFPVRPVPLRLLADWQEAADMTTGWDVWFGIPTQWTPYADIGTPREAEIVANGGNMHI